MNTKIKFIRLYFISVNGQPLYDIVYKSGRVVTIYGAKNLPKTAQLFIFKARSSEQYDSIFKRLTLIYEL